jgi:hypothetical protein
MRRFWAVVTLLAGWVGAAWAFFQKWFLPPEFPPDPPEEDETARRTREQERQNRMGWATGQVVVEPKADSQIGANGNPTPAEPRYPTASRVEEARVVQSSGVDGTQARTGMGGPETKPGPGREPKPDGGLRRDDERDPNGGVDEDQHPGPEENDPRPARPSERGAFLDGAGEDDWRAFIRPPEGQPIARGTQEETPAKPEEPVTPEHANGTAGDESPREENQPAPRPEPQAG